jgi:hypothetical protein
MVDIEGFGEVGIRTCPALQASHREISYFDPQTGALVQAERAKAQIHQIIDQLMLSEDLPYFSEDDFDLLATWDAEYIGKLTAAINEFNDEGQKKAKVELSVTA